MTDIADLTAIASAAIEHAGQMGVSKEDAYDALSKSAAGSTLSDMLRNPLFIEEAKKLSETAAGRKLIREMHPQIGANRGMPLALPGRKPLSAEESTHVVVLQADRKLRERDFPKSLFLQAMEQFFGSKDVTEISCRRLALGPLAKHEIKVWYSPGNGANNRRASSLLGFTVGGAIVITSSQRPTCGDIEAVETLLKSS